jgi:hypothetical protein
MNDPEIPAWIKYAGDLFFLAVFLVFFFFFKPQNPEIRGEEDHENDEDRPNPLEAMLTSDDEEEMSDPDGSDHPDDSPEK